MVFNKEEKVTDVSFILDDFTGRIEVKKWSGSITSFKFLLYVWMEPLH